ncbi:MAG: glycosyltransferase family 2 protein [bacterium]
MPSPGPVVSIVVPVKDEEENLAPLAEEIRRSMESTPWSWECVWVDDGSMDGTLAQLRSLHRIDARHRYVSFDRNHGQTSAMIAGFREARGSILATLDGDGQNDPGDLPALIRRVQEGGADVVNGVRVKRQDNWVRKISSRIGNGFRNWLTGEQVSDVGCSLRVFRRECVAHVPAFEGMHRFLPTLLRMDGWTLQEIPVNHRPRQRGRPKYGVWNRLWRGLLDALAVRWMQWRWIRYRYKETALPPGSEGEAL